MTFAHRLRMTVRDCRFCGEPICYDTRPLWADTGEPHFCEWKPILRAAKEGDFWQEQSPQNQEEPKVASIGRSPKKERKPPSKARLSVSLPPTSEPNEESGMRPLPSTAKRTRSTRTILRLTSEKNDNAS